jgi:FAD:protein FMN transferase
MIYEQQFHAMGCKILALIDAPNRPSLLDEVPTWFEEWEQCLSRFRSDSELSKLNSNSFSGHPLEVSQVLWDVFEASMDAAILTNGLVNPLILDALVHAGYDKNFDLIKNGGPSFFPGLESDVPSLNDVIPNKSELTISLPNGAHLDFGGVAKGWAANQTMESLKVFGPTLVSAGGDIAMSGQLLNGEPWLIGIEDPFKPGAYIETISRASGGVATSGKDYRNWTKNGVKQLHIINPQTGLPAETDILTATVLAPTILEAEAMAKAVLISGSHAGLAWLNSSDNFSGMLILESGQLLGSRNFLNYL